MKAIGVVRYWPDLHVAEHENIGRFRQACANIGYALIELTPDGYRRDTGQRLRAGECELVVNLHFAAPKCYDAPSLAALWNPLDYYRAFGFASALANQFSHDYFAQTGSAATERLLSELRPDYIGPEIRLNHSVPSPLIPPPDLPDYTFCYVGVDWERVTGRPGRHTDLLSALDETGLLRVYGPETLANGIRPWSDFRGYSGSLPFDGNSVTAAARNAGIYLALSSPSHSRDGIMSNRLFEGVAAGCIVVADRHPFVERILGDLAYYVDSDAPLSQTVCNLLELRENLLADPEAARKRAAACQEILADGLLLDQQLERALHLTRKWQVEQQSLTQYKDVACALLPGCIRTADGLMSWLADSPGVLAFSKIAVFTSSEELTDHVERLAGSGRPPHMQLVRLPPGTDSLEAAELIHAVGTWAEESLDDWIVFATGNEYIFSDFVSKTASVDGGDCQVIHHASVRPALRSNLKEQVPNPSLSVPGESMFWTRALSSFVIRRSVVADWLSRHMDAGLLALLMALDADLQRVQASGQAAVIPVPTVCVPRSAAGGDVLGDLWAAESPEALEAIFLRRQRGLLTNEPLGTSASGSWPRELARSGHRGLRNMRTARPTPATESAAQPSSTGGSPHDLVLRFQALSADQRLYILQMMLDEVPASLWRRIYLKLFRSRKLPKIAVESGPS